jgi:hypothetical protein
MPVCCTLYIVTFIQVYALDLRMSPGWVSWNMIGGYVLLSAYCTWRCARCLVMWPHFRPGEGGGAQYLQSFANPFCQSVPHLRCCDLIQAPVWLVLKLMLLKVLNHKSPVPCMVTTPQTICPCFTSPTQLPIYPEISSNTLRIRQFVDLTYLTYSTVQ